MCSPTCLGLQQVAWTHGAGWTPPCPVVSSGSLPAWHLQVVRLHTGAGLQAGHPALINDGGSCTVSLPPQSRLQGHLHARGDIALAVHGKRAENVPEVGNDATPSAHGPHSQL